MPTCHVVVSVVQAYSQLSLSQSSMESVFIILPCFQLMKSHASMDFYILSTKSRGYLDIKNLEFETLICCINNFVFGYSNM